MDRFDETKKIIDKIITFEWDMFQAVNAGGPRATCQDDRLTFEGMRRGQFEAWSAAACESYAEDLVNAELDGRNLVAEKYIHMMKNTAPSQYEVLIQTIPTPDSAVSSLARELSDRLLAQTEALFQEYPFVTGSGRPLCSASDASGITSIETYQLGELLTYSADTLVALKAHLENLETAGRLLAREILENSARYYGYRSLDEAEAAARKHP